MSSSPPLVVADRYRLVAPLGQGGMGRVWRATDVVLHRDVAIKELVPPPGLTAGERQEMRERSLREARAIARLNNINVVRVFDVLRTDADPWIVMEYVPSRSLQDVLAADGPFNPIRAAEMGLGVLGALRAAHRAGVVHRDVKPGNVLIGADGRVVLTDFGLATVPGDPNVTRTGLVLGSPAYIAPERAREGTSGPAADLWSLGATLYAAVEGASPFARPSAIATLAALATENPPPSRNAGPLKPVLNGLLRKDPTHRINAEETERLLLRASGRRSKMTFPMSPTMRRPGVGRERPSLPGSMTGGAPVVPGPRPPVARPVSPPGQPPVTPGRPAAGGSRPPIFVPGKAPVGPAAEKPAAPQPDGQRIDATRLDTPPAREDKTTRLGTGPKSPPRGTPQGAPADGIARTNRGDRGAFTAADVAAYRRTGGPAADATAVVNPGIRPPSKPGRAGAPASSDAAPTTVVNPKAKPAKTPASPEQAESGVDAKAQASAPAEAGSASEVQATGTGTSDSKAAKANAPTTNTPTTGTSKTGTRPSAEPAGEAADGVAGAATDGATGTAAGRTAGAKTPGPRKPGAQPDRAQDDRAQESGSENAAGSQDAKSQDTGAAGSVNQGNANQGNANQGNANQSDAKRGSASQSGASQFDASQDGENRVGASPDGASQDDANQDHTSQDHANEDDASQDDASQDGASRDGVSRSGGVPAAGHKGKTKGTKPPVVAGAKPSGAGNANSAADRTAKVGMVPGGQRGKNQHKNAAAKSSHRPAGQTASTNAAADRTTKLGSVGATAPVSPVSGINRPSRPAWQPMETRPSGPGVTVFGTRLTYRQAAIGGAIVLLVLTLIVVLVAQAVGDEEKPVNTQPNAVPTAGVQGDSRPSPTPPAAKATSAAAPTSAAPSTAPTTAPSSPPAAALPSGWELTRISGSGSSPALTLALPKNARRSGGGSELRFEWNNRLLLVGRTTDPKPDALADWRAQERDRRGDYRGYRLIRIDPVKWRGFPSVADWEYLYTTDRGNPQHVVRRNILVNDNAAYSLNWYVSSGDWAAAQNELKAIYQGFQPK